MVKRVLRWIVVVALLAGAVFAVFWVRTTEQRQVRKRLNALAARFSKNVGESNAVMAVKMHTFPDLFTDDCELELVDFPANGVYTAAQIGSMAARFRPQFKTIALTFHDERILLTGSNTATVTMTARMVTTAGEKGPNEDTREIIASLRKVEDNWLFAGFTEAQVLEK